jgi:hypothetical protein
MSTPCTPASTITRSSCTPSTFLALDGEDLCGLPLSQRKTNLARLLARRPDGIFIALFEQSETGPDLFRAACDMGLEGMVSKRSDRPYRAGRSRDWVKVKNRNHHAFDRVMDRSHDVEIAAHVRVRSSPSGDAMRERVRAPPHGGAGLVPQRAAPWRHPGSG